MLTVNNRILADPDHPITTKVQWVAQSYGTRLRNKCERELPPEVPAASA
jgi:hypothetical protein